MFTSNFSVINLHSELYFTCSVAVQQQNRNNRKFYLCMDTLVSLVPAYVCSLMAPTIILYRNMGINADLYITISVNFEPIFSLKKKITDKLPFEYTFTLELCRHLTLLNMICPNNGTKVQRCLSIHLNM